MCTSQKCHKEDKEINGIEDSHAHTSPETNIAEDRTYSDFGCSAASIGKVFPNTASIGSA